MAIIPKTASITHFCPLYFRIEALLTAKYHGSESLLAKYVRTDPPTADGEGSHPKRVARLLQDLRPVIRHFANTNDFYACVLIAEQVFGHVFLWMDCDIN